MVVLVVMLDFKLDGIDFGRLSTADIIDDVVVVVIMRGLGLTLPFVAPLLHSDYEIIMKNDKFWNFLTCDDNLLSRISYRRSSFTISVSI